MSLSRLGTLALLIAVGATACGTSRASTSSSSSALPTQTSSAKPPATAPAELTRSAGPTGLLDIRSSGDDGAPASVRYVRIETTKAKAVTEKAFRKAAISLAQPLAPGTYRVMTWRRDCAATCPDQGEKGLGGPLDICGARVEVRADATTRTTVRLAGDTNCTMEASSPRAG